MKGARGVEGMQRDDIEQGCKAFSIQLKKKKIKTREVDVDVVKKGYTPKALELQDKVVK